MVYVGETGFLLSLGTGSGPITPQPSASGDRPVASTSGKIDCPVSPLTM